MLSAGCRRISTGCLRAGDTAVFRFRALRPPVPKGSCKVFIAAILSRRLPVCFSAKLLERFRSNYTKCARDCQQKYRRYLQIFFFGFSLLCIFTSLLIYETFFIYIYFTRILHGKSPDYLRYCSEPYANLYHTDFNHSKQIFN